MSGRTIVITGATKGLGRCLALTFARVGYRVLGLYRQDEVAAEELRAALVKAGAGAEVIRHDITGGASQVWTHEAIQSATSLSLINNATAPFHPKPLHLEQWADFESQINVHLKGAWHCTTSMLRPLLRCQSGAVVNVLSSAVFDSAPKGFCAYNSAKHALRGFTLSLASEYRERGLRIFSVSPGFMKTSLTESWDARLVQGIESGGATSDPETASERILQLVEDSQLPANGENYHV